MRKHLVSAVALAAFVHAAFNMFFFRGEDTTSHREAEDSEVWLSKLENRLGQLETRFCFFSQKKIRLEEFCLLLQ